MLSRDTTVLNTALRKSLASRFEQVDGTQIAQWIVSLKPPRRVACIFFVKSN